MQSKQGNNLAEYNKYHSLAQKNVFLSSKMKSSALSVKENRAADNYGIHGGYK
jgi:hypothetical protein